MFPKNIISSFCLLLFLLILSCKKEDPDTSVEPVWISDYIFTQNNHIPPIVFDGQIVLDDNDPCELLSFNQTNGSYISKLSNTFSIPIYNNQPYVFENFISFVDPYDFIIYCVDLATDNVKELQLDNSLHVSFEFRGIDQFACFLYDDRIMQIDITTGDTSTAVDLGILFPDDINGINTISPISMQKNAQNEILIYAVVLTPESKYVRFNTSTDMVENILNLSVLGDLPSLVGYTNVSGDNFYFQSANKMYCMDIGSGNIKWQTDYETEPFALEENGKTFIIEEDGNRLKALNPETGEDIWISNYDLSFFGIHAPVYHDGKLYISNRDLVSIDAQTGDVGWEYEVLSDDQFESQLTIDPANNCLYITTGMHLMKFDL